MMQSSTQVDLLFDMYEARGPTRLDEVRENSGAFALTTSSITMEIMAVTRAIAWLETQTFH
jgi:hypothetical protein